MNELRRLAYLRAMDTDTYISLRQLPGAATTRRLAVVPKPPLRLSQGSAGDETCAARELPAAPSLAPDRRPATAAPVPASTSQSTVTDIPARFSLAAISCGGWLWLEELASASFTAEQLQLLQAMAAALDLNGAGDRREQSRIRPEVTQFDWPIHTNRQLDLGTAAAGSSAAGFIRRKLEQLNSRGLVLLGQSCETRVALDELECPRLVRTVSTAAMLSDPLLKKQAWRDLQPFFQSV